MTSSLPPFQPGAPKCSSEYISTLRDEWREVFIIAAEIYVTGALIFIILGSGKTQPWAIHKSNDVITTSSKSTGSRDCKDEEKRPLLSHSQDPSSAKYNIA